ncbi:MAG TPA: hypothetical protein V6C97_27855, partial [Oculatellaceae cyanobacterium]
MKCNISYHNRWTRIPVIFHNGSRYDNHFFVEELCHQATAKNKKIDVIPKTKENYTTITAGKLQFLDSCCHLTSSLENLVENLKKDG